MKVKVKTKQQKLPKWFKGELYEEGAVVKNRFSGEEYELNAMELSMYDLTINEVTNLVSFLSPKFQPVDSMDWQWGDYLLQKEYQI